MFLGIDLGTTELKVLLMSGGGGIVGTAHYPLEISRAKHRWSEQDPEDWWRATRIALATLRHKHPEAFSRVEAIGLSGQMHGAVLLGADDQPLRPAILWNDMRSDSECAELEARAPRLREIAGNCAMPGLTAPKLLWVARHEPECFRLLTTVLLPKDYIRLRLTGVKLTDASDASGTLWMDVEHRNWSDELLHACEMTQAKVPLIVEGCRATGVVLASVATDLGLPSNVLVAAGGGDTATSALGVGATEPGEGFLSLGTSGVLSVVTERFRPSPELGLHALCHALPDRWHRTSVVLSAASCLRWLCKLTSVDEDCLLAEAESISESARDKAPLFLPYLSGERTPHNDPYAQGVFCGLSHSTDRGTLAYSAIEGVAFALSDGLSALRADGTRDTSIRLIGGGARSAFWAQLLADALGIVLHRPFETSYIAALGAARLGCVAGGGDLTSVIRPQLRSQEFFPQNDRRQILSERLASYRSLYREMRWLFPR